ncbi:MAG: nicotinate-nicotinamide nucleotide adenylyltransferase [Phycisphaerales bacterium]
MTLPPATIATPPPPPPDAPGRRHIALLGGAFDPPTLGHIDAARFVLEHAPDMHECYLTPPARHRFGKPMAPAPHRLAMLALACAGQPGIRPFDYELVRDLPGDTFTFVRTLLADPAFTPACRFSFVIGSDNAETFSKWHRAAELAALIPFLVLPRQGAQNSPLSDWAKSPPHRILAPTREIIKTSSTEARAALATGSPAPHLLLPAVEAYARAHGLYPPAHS